MRRSITATLAALLLAAPAAAHGRRHHYRGHADGRTAPSRIDEYGALTLRGKGSSTTIAEHGHGWGSFHCDVYINLTLRGTLVSAEYHAYPHGGQIAGTAKARIHSATSGYASFSGTIWLHGGSGSFASASGRAGFYGTINRHSYAMRVHIAGRVRL